MTGARTAAPVLDGKLYPATGTGMPVLRPRLDFTREVLEGSCPVVLVTAPAGYGKSTLMARWHALLTERGVNCAWLSLDGGDNDKARFVRHLVAALQKVDSRVGKTALGQLSGNFAGGVQPLLETLAGDLARVHRRTVLFLDDFQFLKQSEVIDIVDWLVNYAPRSLHYVVGSREEPLLRLGGLRVRRQLFELDYRQLQFGIDEASQFFRSRLGAELAAHDLQQVMARTEGWPAALELAALAMRGATNHTDLIEQFAGTDKNVVDYLAEVVLARMDERTREFVSRIALLDRISAPLAQTLTGAADADELLRALCARNLFLIPLDRSASWLRFHHLVGQFFRERYLRVNATEAKACLLSGARWLYENGFREEAIDHAVRARNWEEAARWIAENVEELTLRRGYHQTILRWMNSLPEDWVDRYPIIRIQYAFALSFYPRQQEVEAQVYRLRRLQTQLESRPQPDRHLVDDLRCAVELQAAMSLALRDEGKRGGELAEAWLEQWPNAPLLRKGVMGNVLAFGHKTTGEIGKGLEVLGETRRWLAQCEGYYSLAWAAYIEAVLHLKRGSYLEARRACLIGLEQIDRDLNGHPAHASLLHTALAAIAYEFNEIEPANELIEKAMTSVDEYGPADAVILAYLTRTRLQVLRRDEIAARAILHEGQELGERRGLRRVTITLAAEECTWLCRASRYEDARVVAAQFGFDELPGTADSSDLSDDKAFRAASRYLLQQSPLEVARGLESAVNRCRRGELFHRCVELLLLQALAYMRGGEAGLATEALHKALIIAAPRQYQRVFLDEATELRAILDRMDPAQMRGSEAAPLARHLQQSIRRPNDLASAIEASPATAEELTKRELAILRRLESGLGNKEIAEAIFISEGTLKWHLHNIYGKLDVKNRSGAMVRARAMGIL